MAYSSVFLLIEQVFENAVLWIEIGVYVSFVHIVEKIEVKIVRAAFFELLFEYLFDLVHVREIVSGKLRCEIVAFSRISAE